MHNRLSIKEVLNLPPNKLATYESEMRLEAAQETILYLRKLLDNVQERETAALRNIRYLEKGRKAFYTLLPFCGGSLISSIPLSETGITWQLAVGWTLIASGVLVAFSPKFFTWLFSKKRKKKKISINWPYVN